MAEFAQWKVADNFKDFKLNVCKSFVIRRQNGDDYMCTFYTERFIMCLSNIKSITNTASHAWVV